MNEEEVQRQAMATETFELTDCGRASEKTQGLPIYSWFELGTPPWNKRPGG